MDTTVKTAICPATPLKQGNVYFYPLTTHNQVILKEGYTWEDIFSSIDVINSGIIGGGGEGGETVIGIISVNNKTGSAITLTAADVNARPDTWVPAIDDINGLRDALNDSAAAGGGVVTINGIAPDENGNIKLEDVVKEEEVSFETITVGTITADKVIGAVYE